MTTPMRLPQTKMLSPKTGARSLLPTISRAMTTAPETKTSSRMPQREP
ncbi:hypothetical protein ES703_81599 [subsurface metagenome]